MGALTFALLASQTGLSAVPLPKPCDPEPSDSLQAKETKEQRDARMAWWRTAKYGLFIHWGSSSVPAGYYNGKPVNPPAEWMMAFAQIPVAEYEKYATKIKHHENVNVTYPFLDSHSMLPAFRPCGSAAHPARRHLPLV